MVSVVGRVLVALVLVAFVAVVCVVVVEVLDQMLVFCFFRKNGGCDCHRKIHCQQFHCSTIFYIRYLRDTLYHKYLILVVRFI